MARDTQDRETRGSVLALGAQQRMQPGLRGSPRFPDRLHGGNGKRKIFSAMATSRSAGGNNRWRHAIYSQKHKGTASCEEAGGGRLERQGAAP